MTTGSPRGHQTDPHTASGGPHDDHGHFHPVELEIDDVRRRTIVGAVPPPRGAVAATGTPLVIDRWPCWTGERVGLQ
jgi:hypothetical protein